MTRKARSRLATLRRALKAGLRLRQLRDGRLTITPGRWRSGDMSYAHGRSAVLVVEGRLARALDDHALEVADEGLQLRRHGPGGREPTRSVAIFSARTPPANPPRDASRTPVRSGRRD